MVYMASASRSVLFGGVLAESPWYLGDTWEWGGDGWVQVADTGPNARANPKLAYDADRSVVVLFGGYASDSGAFFDTWEWAGDGWVQVADTGPQAQGYQAAMVYDSARKVTVLEGGSIRTKGVGTWTWDGATWTQVADVGPAERENFPLAFDSTRGRAVLFGGALTGSKLERDTWEWDGAVWTEVEDIGPSARHGHAMTWKGDTVLLFGGSTDLDLETNTQALADTWEWDGSTGDSVRTWARSATPPRSRGTLPELGWSFSAGRVRGPRSATRGRRSSRHNDVNQGLVRDRLGLVVAPRLQLALLDPQRLRKLRVLATNLLDEAFRLLTADEDVDRIAER